MYTSTDDLNAFRAHPNWLDAMALDLMLRLVHGAREGPFAASPRAMPAANILPGRCPNRIRAARSTCLQMGRLTLTHKGGSRRGGPSLYVLGRAARYGVWSDTQYNCTSRRAERGLLARISRVSLAVSDVIAGFCYWNHDVGGKEGDRGVVDG